MSYSALIVPAVNAHYGKAATDESLRETIRSIVREELVTAPVQLGDLLQALKTAVNTYYFHPVIIDGSFAHATNRGINTGTVPAGC